MNKSVAQQNNPRKENDDFLKVQKTHSVYNECISLHGTTGNRRHHMHLKLFNVSLLLRKLFPLLNFLSTEWKAAFGGCTTEAPFVQWRTADEIAYILSCSLSLSLQRLLVFSLYFSLILKYQDHILFLQLKNRL